MQAQVSREMVEDGDWIFMELDNEPYFRKPPLSHWVRAIFFNLFGINGIFCQAGLCHFWSRCAFAVFLIAEVVENKNVAWLSVAILL